MDALHEFALLRPSSLDEVLAIRAEHPDGRLLGGGTDLVVNLRRGIGPLASALVDVTGVRELRGITIDGDEIRVGAGVRIAELATHAAVRDRFPAIAGAAGSIAGPTHRNMGTVGGNLCLDTRCIFYNQSEWWRAANDYCLKHRGSRCHVAPGSDVCYATFSGDLAPAFLVLEAQVEIAGPNGERMPALGDLYTGDGERYLALAPGEIVVAVRARATPTLRNAYDKRRVRRSIEYPLAGAAVALARDGDALATLRVAFTGTNPRPFLVEGIGELIGAPVDEAVLERLDALMRKQVMAMRTTFASGHHRRRVAGVIARRLVERLWQN